MAIPSSGSSDLLGDYWLPSEEDIIELHAGVLHARELRGIRDYNLLGSAVARPRQLLIYEGDQPVHALAASVSYGLLKNHIFVDGNKRAAFMALISTLDANGYSLNLTQDAAVNLMEGAAKAEHEAGYVSQDEFNQIIEHNHQPWSYMSHSYESRDERIRTDIECCLEEDGWRATANIADEFGWSDELMLVERTYVRAVNAMLDELDAYEPPNRYEDYSEPEADQ